VDFPYLSVLVAVCCAIFFFRVAQYERLSALSWALGSAGLSAGVMMLGRGVGVMLAGQVVLFAVLWWHNANRKDPWQT
jgi:hypothetical protein